jgi:tRNA(His) 5'-end guanylyltransferase
MRWRQEGATRNCLNGYCYWKLREEGKSARHATSELLRQSVSYKNELLFRRGINFNEVPAWQKRGTGLRWLLSIKKGFNPKTRQPVESVRKTLYEFPELPYGEDYGRLIRGLLSETRPS